MKPDRKQNIDAALRAIAAHAGVDGVIGDAPPMFSRLIADLAHLAERNGHDLGRIMERAATTYEAERQQSD